MVCLQSIHLCDNEKWWLLIWLGPPKSGLPHGKCVNKKGLILSNACVTWDNEETSRTVTSVPKMFDIFFSPAYFAFRTHKPLRKNIHGRFYPTPETPCFWYFKYFLDMFAIYISRIIKNFVSAFDKTEKYKKQLLPFIYIYITWAMTLHFKSFMADSMLRTHPFPHFVKKTVEGNQWSSQPLIGRWTTRLDRKQELNVLYQVRVFGPIAKPRYLPWRLISGDIFDIFSENTEQNLTTLDRNQDLDVPYPVCVFRADRKKKMAALASNWLTRSTSPLNGIWWSLPGSKNSTSRNLM